MSEQQFNVQIRNLCLMVMLLSSLGAFIFGIRDVNLGTRTSDAWYIFVWIALCAYAIAGYYHKKVRDEEGRLPESPE